MNSNRTAQNSSPQQSKKLNLNQLDKIIEEIYSTESAFLQRIADLKKHKNAYGKPGSEEYIMLDGMQKLAEGLLRKYSNGPNWIARHKTTDGIVSYSIDTIRAKEYFNNLLPLFELSRDFSADARHSDRLKRSSVVFGDQRHLDESTYFRDTPITGTQRVLKYPLFLTEILRLFEAKEAKAIEECILDVKNRALFKKQAEDAKNFIEQFSKAFNEATPIVPPQNYVERYFEMLAKKINDYYNPQKPGKRTQEIVALMQSVSSVIDSGDDILSKIEQLHDVIESHRETIKSQKNKRNTLQRMPQQSHYLTFLNILLSDLNTLQQSSGLINLLKQLLKKVSQSAPLQTTLPQVPPQQAAASTPSSPVLPFTPQVQSSIQKLIDEIQYRMNQTKLIIESAREFLQNQSKTLSNSEQINKMNAAKQQYEKHLIALNQLHASIASIPKPGATYDQINAIHHQIKLLGNQIGFGPKRNQYLEILIGEMTPKTAINLFFQQKEMPSHLKILFNLNHTMIHSTDPKLKDQLMQIRDNLENHLREKVQDIQPNDATAMMKARQAFDSLLQPGGDGFKNAKAAAFLNRAAELLVSYQEEYLQYLRFHKPPSSRMP